MKIENAASAMGKASYKARLSRLGIDRIRAIARENGKLGGRPKKTTTEGERNAEAK